MELKLPNSTIKLQNMRMKDLIEKELMNWIMDGRLDKGQRLREDELAEIFGVSRIPVREALHVLELKGLVEVTPYIGATVRQLSSSEVQQVYLMRGLLEPLAAEYAAELITKKELINLKSIQEELESLCSVEHNPENRRKVYDKNRDFHMAIYNASKMDILVHLINNLWDNIAFLRIRSAYSPDYPEMMKREHRDYIHLLSIHDGKTLSKVLRENLEQHAKLFQVI